MFASSSFSGRNWVCHPTTEEYKGTYIQIVTLHPDPIFARTRGSDKDYYQTWDEEDIAGEFMQVELIAWFLTVKVKTQRKRINSL